VPNTLDGESARRRGCWAFLSTPRSWPVAWLAGPMGVAIRPWRPWQPAPRPLAHQQAALDAQEQPLPWPRRPCAGSAAIG